MTKQHVGGSVVRDYGGAKRTFRLEIADIEAIELELDIGIFELAGLITRRELKIYQVRVILQHALSSGGGDGVTTDAVRELISKNDLADTFGLLTDLILACFGDNKGKGKASGTTKSG